MSVAKDIANQVVDGTGNRMKLKIGDRVIHGLTGLRGAIKEIREQGDQLLLSVETADGRMLRNLPRQEFRLASGVRLQ